MKLFAEYNYDLNKWSFTEYDIYDTYNLQIYLNVISVDKSICVDNFQYYYTLRNLKYSIGDFKEFGECKYIKIIDTSQDFLFNHLHSMLPNCHYEIKFNINVNENKSYYYYNFKSPYPPKPFPSWHMEKEKCVWSAPKPRPKNDNEYYWDEDKFDWIEKQ